MVTGLWLVIYIHPHTGPCDVVTTWLLTMHLLQSWLCTFINFDVEFESIYCLFLKCYNTFRAGSVLTCICEPSTVLLQASSVRLMVSRVSTELWICVVEGGDVQLSVFVTGVPADRWSWSIVWTSALYWLAKASSYWSVHWRILLSHPSAVFSSSTLASVVEFWTEEKHELADSSEWSVTYHRGQVNSRLTFILIDFREPSLNA